MTKNINLVEMVADEQAFNQPCRFGNLADRHAVYCHNVDWQEAPARLTLAGSRGARPRTSARRNRRRFMSKRNRAIYCSKHGYLKWCSRR